MVDEEGRENEGKDTLDSGTVDVVVVDVVLFVSGTRRLVCHDSKDLSSAVCSDAAQAVLTFPGFALKSTDLFFSSTVFDREASAAGALP